jgi:hypothetical protein
VIVGDSGLLQSMKEVHDVQLLGGKWSCYLFIYPVVHPSVPGVAREQPCLGSENGNVSSKTVGVTSKIGSL